MHFWSYIDQLVICSEFCVFLKRVSTVRLICFIDFHVSFRTQVFICCCSFQNVTCLLFLLLSFCSILFLLMLVHTGIRIAVLDYFQFRSIEKNLCYLSSFCLCAVYESADDTGLLMLLYILSANLLHPCMLSTAIVLCLLTFLLFIILLSLFLLC